MTWFETVWSYDVGSFFQWKLNKVQTEKLYWNLGVFLVCLKSLRQVRFYRIDFTIFRAKVWKILIFEWILLLEIQANCKNWVWKEKSVKLVHIAEFWNFQFWNCAHMFFYGKCVHTWTNDIGYTSCFENTFHQKLL